MTPPSGRPDSAKISFNDNSGSLFYVDLKTGDGEEGRRQSHHAAGHTIRPGRRIPAGSSIP